MAWCGSSAARCRMLLQCQEARSLRLDTVTTPARPATSSIFTAEAYRSLGGQVAAPQEAGAVGTPRRARRHPA